jgi:hypothetical protein
MIDALLGMMCKWRRMQKKTIKKRQIFFNVCFEPQTSKFNLYFQNLFLFQFNNSPYLISKPFPSNACDYTQVQ